MVGRDDVHGARLDGRTGDQMVEPHGRARHDAKHEGKEAAHGAAEQPAWERAAGVASGARGIVLGGGRHVPVGDVNFYVGHLAREGGQTGLEDDPDAPPTSPQKKLDAQAREPPETDEINTSIPRRRALSADFAVQTCRPANRKLYSSRGGRQRRTQHSRQRGAD
jgi:hypothetical protein